jgi:hypothetical protein
MSFLTRTRVDLGKAQTVTHFNLVPLLFPALNRQQSAWPFAPTRPAPKTTVPGLDWPGPGPGLMSVEAWCVMAAVGFGGRADGEIDVFLL